MPVLPMPTPAAGAVNSQVYRGLRRLFIERLDVDPGFDFHR